MTGNFSSLLSAKIPKSLLFLLLLTFFTISNCRCFSACYEKLWGRDGRYNFLNDTEPSLFSDQKVSSRLFLEIYCSPAFIHTFITPVVFQLPSILLALLCAYLPGGGQAGHIPPSAEMTGQSGLGISNSKAASCFQSKVYPFKHSILFTSDGNDPVGQTHLGQR